MPGAEGSGPLGLVDGDDELESGRDVVLLHEVGDVSLDRGLGDDELFGDLGIGIAITQQGQDGLLGLGDIGGLGRLRGPQVASDEPGGGGRGDRGSAALAAMTARMISSGEAS